MSIHIYMYSVHFDFTKKPAMSKSLRLKVKECKLLFKAMSLHVALIGLLADSFIFFFEECVHICKFIIIHVYV